ncbi:pleckstrin homology domain-containing family S member 1 [Bombina bombina]|uniref:pleckstrin homology domain-containing family S member 1 n=1 Tax=Bombina bombina TaxID=8345 RepID=UPI00235ABEF2|nr:pleckstrin homology domain-containing family S member 1 [Bombina bombina]XP_053548674.1 pleckstrin homology domain-containing family S member 1 [Bombina bombina]
MLTKRRSLSVSEISENNIIRKGSLIKSPPAYIFGNKNSWKTRSFALWTAPGDVYKLSYYMNSTKEDPIGSIMISEIQEIRCGLTKEENNEAFVKWFNCSEQNVLCLKTEKRKYFLIGNDAQEWYSSIYSVWNPNSSEAAAMSKFHVPRKLQTPDDELVSRFQVSPNLQDRYSYPTNNPSSGIYVPINTERPRCNTDPVQPSGCSYPNIISPADSGTLSIISESSGHGTLDYFTDPEYESPDEEEAEDIYDVPSNKPLYLSYSTAASEPQEFSDAESIPSITDDVYVIMNSINVSDPQKQDTAIANELPEAELSHEEFKKRLQEDEKKFSPPKPIRKAKATQDGSTPSKVNKVPLTCMVFENRELIKQDITVPKEHLKTYLTLEDIGDRICVSQWNGPKEIGCLFSHGDQLYAINDIKLGKCESFRSLLNDTLKNEVKLTIYRHANAQVFHVQGCTGQCS